MPGPKAQAVVLSEAEQADLAALIKRHQVGQQTALRARIVLAAAQKQTNTAIAQQYGVTLDMVRLWRSRWLKLQDIPLADLSVEDRLQDLPRPGAPATLTADQRCRIEALACEKPTDSARPITHWTAREIADEVKQRGIVTTISPRHAARLLKISRSQTAFESVLADPGV